MSGVLIYRLTQSIPPRAPFVTWARGTLLLAVPMSTRITSGTTVEILEYLPGDPAFDRIQAYVERWQAHFYLMGEPE